MSSTKRRVKKPRVSGYANLSTPRYSKTQKAQIRSAQRAKKLALTQARKYLVYAIACFLSSQLIKFLLYSVVYRGDSAPPDWLFALVVYIQIGLLLATFVFMVMAAFKALQRIFTEEL